MSGPHALRAGHWMLLAAGLVLSGACAPQDTYDGHFALVVESDTSFTEVGAASPRELYAQLLEALPSGEASSVVLRFFLLDERDGEIDARLAAAMAARRTYTQYALRGEGPAPITASTPGVGALGDTRAPDGASLLRAEGSEIPPPRFADAIRGMGFVDVVQPFDPDLVPLIATGADGALVKSLALLLLEEVHGPAEFVAVPAMSLRLGGATLELDANGRAACEIMAVAIEPVDIVAILKDGGEALGDRIPVVSYDGVEAPRFRIGLIRSIGSHELFFRRLACLDARIAASP
ncbi:MAG TPA: CHASE2 domain-containing protein [Pseudomonadales bacterium]|nr:CHASE2 domain-containing protein [Pseudomonadales bacterium]